MYQVIVFILTIKFKIIELSILKNIPILKMENVEAEVKQKTQNSITSLESKLRNAKFQTRLDALWICELHFENWSLLHEQYICFTTKIHKTGSYKSFKISLRTDS